MDISTFLRDYMRENVPAIEQRIYRGSSIAGTGRPYIVQYKVGDPLRTYGSRQVRFQFTCFGESFGQTREVANQVRSAIEAIHEDDDNGIFAAYVDSDTELYDQDSGLHQIPIDGLFYFQDKFIWG